MTNDEKKILGDLDFDPMSQPQHTASDTDQQQADGAVNDSVGHNLTRSRPDITKDAVNQEVVTRSGRVSKHQACYCDPEFVYD